MSGSPATDTEGVLSLPPELLGQTARYAVYRCYSDHGDLLYIGTTGQLGRRLASHAQKVWFLNVRGITLEWYADELDALQAERRAIHVEHPKYNIQHRNSPIIRKTRPHRRAPSRPRGTRTATEAAARQILAASPGISGSELGRQLGKTDRYGRQLIVRLSENTSTESEANSQCTQMT